MTDCRELSRSHRYKFVSTYAHNDVINSLFIFPAIQYLNSPCQEVHKIWHLAVNVPRLGLTNHLVSSLV